MKDYSVLLPCGESTMIVIHDAFDKGYKQGYKDGKADTPFTDTEEAEKKAYQRGFEDGKKEKPQVIYEMKVEEYNKGLNEAWEVARKIEHPKGYFCNIKEVFGEESAFSVLLNMTASEAIQKIKDYEDKQKQKQDDWRDIPSDEMTLDQARRAVKQLRAEVVGKILVEGE